MSTTTTIATAQSVFARMDSVGQSRMAALHGGRRDKLEVSPNLWAGVGLVRGGAGTALVGDPETVAARMKEYMALGIDTFILSGYPHLEEAYRFAELVMPLLPLAQSRAHGAASRSTPGRSARRSPTIIRPPARAAAVMASLRQVARALLPTASLAWALPIALVVVWEIAARDRPALRRASCRRRATSRSRSGRHSATAPCSQQCRDHRPSGR